MIRTQYLIYTAKNFSTGLTDVTANVFKDGSNVAVATGLALSEISTGDFPGRYRLALTPTQINAFGGVGTYSISIDSTSKPAPATAKIVVTGYNSDDLEAHLVVIEGKIDALSSSLSAVASNVTSIKGTVEDSNSEIKNASYGLSAIQGLIAAVQAGVSSIQNATRTVVAFPTELITPPTGGTIYKVQIRIYNGDGALEDPDSNSVQVSLSNASGLDRGNLFQGGGASPKAATRLGQGKYEIVLEIPAGQTKEQINMAVDYTEGTVPLQAVRSANIVDQIQASGLAQQITLQEVLDDTSVMQPQVADVQSKINDVNFGLSALKSALNAITSIVNSSNAILNSGTIGNQAIIDAISLTASQVSVNNLIADVGLVKGAGFDTSVDSLKKISDRQFTGGYVS